MARLQILMYHAIGGREEQPTRFVLPVDKFARQMRVLATLPLSVVPLEQALESLRRGESLPRRSVALTFDDGTRDLYTLGLPVLQRHGFAATAFVVTRAMGSNVDWTEIPGIAGREIMSWSEALELQSLVSIQPHTRTHASLPKISDEALGEELAGSRADVEARTGKPATLFAYPYGHYDTRVAEATATAGYTAACTVKRGLNDVATPAFELHRHEVHGELPLTSFAKLLAGRA